MQNLGTLGGENCVAVGINNVGQVVGGSWLPGNTTGHGFLWTSSGGMQDLNNLIPAGSGWVLQDARGINSAGQITGLGTISGQTHAYLLTPTS
jgi:probable HAF family extracellular repeat protein